MPKVAKPKKLPALHEKIVQQYIKEGAVPEKMAVVEKRFRLKKGAVAKVLKLKAVQAALQARLGPLQMEQQRQQMVGDAVAEVTAKLERENQEFKAQIGDIKAVSNIRVTGNEELLEQRLMQLVLGLDMKKHPSTILDALKTSFVVAGVMRQGNTERVQRTESPAAAGGIYQNLFERKRLEAGQKTEAGPSPTAQDDKKDVVDAVAGADGVFDLMPGTGKAAEPPADVPQGKREFVLPAAGESIDAVLKKVEKKPTVKGATSVLTVVVG